MAADPVRLVVFGAAGRLGSRIVALAADCASVSVVQARVRTQSAAAGQPVPGHGSLTYAHDAMALAPADAAVDVSLGEAAAGHVRMCMDSGMPILLASTGLGDDATQAATQAATRVGVCVAPNLGAGVWVLAHLVKQAAALLADFDVEISETHHRHKKDAPSGTAMMLARHVADSRHATVDQLGVTNRSSAPSVRTAGSVGLAALRGGDVVGDHTVYLLGDGERLELTHRAHSRDVFAHGALRLVPRLVAAGPGLHTVPALLGLH